MHRTSIMLDEQLVDACQKITGIKTRRVLVDYALRELLRKEEQAKILELKGKLKWNGDLDSMRESRFPS